MKTESETEAAPEVAPLEAEIGIELSFSGAGLNMLNDI
jgi:hypothetical protein